MGQQTLPDRANGQTIDENWFNLIKQILCGELVPRDSDGVATSLAGQLGTASLIWLYGYLQSVLIGGSSEYKLDVTANKLIISHDVDGNDVYTEVARIGTTGIEVTSFADGTITYAKLNDNAKIVEKITTITSGASNFVVPTNVTELEIEGIGAGGAGASGNGSANGGGGGGGGGGEYGIAKVSVTPGASLAYSVGAAVTGPPQTAINAAGATGSNGNNTTFADGTRTWTWRGGTGGTAGVTTSGGAGGALTARVPFRTTSGGAGAAGAVNGTAGETTATFAGGAGATSGNPSGGNGGGGAATVFGSGGAGGQGGLGGGGVGSPGSNASATAYGAGGGGGGGQETPTAPGRGGKGGDSAGGLLRIRYIAPLA
jgi:hypothetical protein